MALLTVERPSLAGDALVYAAASASDTFKNTGKEFLHVKNGGVAATTVTVTAPNACSFGVVNAAHADVVVVGAGLDAEIGPFDRAKHNNAAGITTVTFNPITSVTVALMSA